MSVIFHMDSVVNVTEHPTAGMMVDNTPGAAIAKFIAELQVASGRTIIVVVSEPESVVSLEGDMEIFGSLKNVFSFPAWDLLPSETDNIDPDVAGNRIAALRALLFTGDMERKPVVIAPVTALMQPAIAPENLRSGRLSISPGFEISPEAMAARLVDAGLEAANQVDGPGQFCRRGGIMDVFPVFADCPYRLEWFGDEIDTIRPFDIVTQRSENATDEEIVLIDVTLDCFRRSYESVSPSVLLDYAPEDSLVVIVHPDRLEHVAGLYYSGFDPRRCPVLEVAKAVNGSRELSRIVLSEISGEDWPSGIWGKVDNFQRFDYGAQTVERLSGGTGAAFKEMQSLLAADATVYIYCHNAGEKQRLHELLLEKGGGIASEVELLLGHLSKGFAYRDKDGLHVVVGDHEIFGRYSLRRTPRKKFSGLPIGDFTELREGDYVVHVVNGIAKYEGMETLEQNGTEQDYMVLRFAESARVYVPLSHIDLVQRYVGSRDGRPTLSKLGGKMWARRRRAAERAARDVAADLLRVQAVRRALPGIAFPPDDDLQREFDESFPYEETPDQMAAIMDIKSDQERANPMDRLLCGDVGFGKTEVAVRAAFKAINAGKQVAVLVPTTILAEQHYRTFSERMADYPVVVACLSRFRTNAEQKSIVESLKVGKVDVVVGTHRLVSKDVGFRDLGLVIIDEEQRFGVEHKERLKELRASVDILTMTATPIPRTLNMSLMGLRDISNLATPPTDRQSIRTEVVRYSDELVRRAILRELSRGGQCFFLHNRVYNIDNMAAQLARLVPEARFGIAHGQMPEKQLLEIMNRFLDGKIDVLVCTTIIESGVDIPTVNTLFVNDADHFGLGELHQLRGRVGRYRNKAYAYFLVPQKRPVTPIARKRLQALEEYSELGAGFRIAMRDLEIRGAGNVLGLEQSGHIHQVGFDLYCRLLERAVAVFNGEEIEEYEPVELDLGTRAFVPTEYIPDDSQRIQFYRKLSAIRDYETLENLRSYIIDRYGKFPLEVDRCFRDQLIRVKAAAAGVNYMGRIDGVLAIGFTESKARINVPRLRTLGRTATPLEGKRWRVAISDEEKGPALLDTVEVLLNNLGESTYMKLQKDKALKRKPSIDLSENMDELSQIEAIAVTLDREVIEPNEVSDNNAKMGLKVNSKPKIDRISVGKKLSGKQMNRIEVSSRPESKKINRIEVGTKSGKSKIEIDMALAMNVTTPNFIGEGKPPMLLEEVAHGWLPCSAIKILGVEPNINSSVVGAVIDEKDFRELSFGPVTLIMGQGEVKFFLRYSGTGRASAGRALLKLLAADNDEAILIVEKHFQLGESWVVEGVVE